MPATRDIRLMSPWSRRAQCEAWRKQAAAHGPCWIDFISRRKLNIFRQTNQVMRARRVTIKNSERERGREGGREGGRERERGGGEGGRERERLEQCSYKIMVNF